MEKDLNIDALGELFNKNESSVSITEDYLEKIKSNNEIFAFLSTLDQSAKKQAILSDERRKKNESKGPLDGIPIAIKDNICLKNTITTAGSKILENYKASYTATVLNKLDDQGAVFLGKTNLDEFAMGSSTENSAYGKTKNPLDMTRVPGGSSGGSAAAVAADLCIAALGSDTGGSIRQPASYCGVVGFKPSYGAVSRYGLVAYGSSLDQIGPITKNVTDARLIFNAIRGLDENDATTKDYQCVKQKGDKLKVGIVKLSPEPQDLSYKVFKDSIKKIQETNDVEIEEIELKYLEYSLPAYYIIAFAESSSNLSRFDGIRYGLRAEASDLLGIYKKTRGKGFGPEVRRRIILGTFVLSSGYYDAYYKKAMQVRTLIRKDFIEAFKKFDVLVMPTAPEVAFKFGQKTDNPLTMYLSDIYTVPVNLAGIPAISIPCGKAPDSNMPVGFQILGAQGADDLLLDAARKFEIIFDYKR